MGFKVFPAAITPRSGVKGAIIIFRENGAKTPYLGNAVLVPGKIIFLNYPESLAIFSLSLSS